MQCQGKTRIGNRCRNRSLDGELFCDIHMRVNHTHNLALMIPTIGAILLGYFFFFGLLFETLSLNVFDISYIQYAGLDDLFLNMVRFGSAILALLFGLWLIYATLIGVIFTFVLMVQITRNTYRQKLGFFNRLKIIALSIGIFLLNVLRRALFIVPSREGYRKNKIVVTQDNFAKARYKIQNTTGSSRPGRPITTARSVFEYYLYFNSMGNHRFTIFSIFLFLFSFSLLYYAVHKAEYARACNLLAAAESVESSAMAPLSSAYTIGTPCRLDALYEAEKTDITDTKDVTANVEAPFHIDLINDFFDFFPVTVETKEGPAKLLHLRTTSRFDIFYNGSSGSPIVIPKGVLIFPEATHEPQTDFPHLTRLETKFTSLENQLQLSVDSLEGFGRQIEESTVLRLEEQFIGLEQQLKASLEGLDSLSDQLKENTEQLSLFRLSASDADSSANTTGHTRTGKRGQREKLAKIPQECWGKSPDYIVEYSSGVQTVTNAEILKSIVDLSISYRNLTTDSLIITGFADRPGSTEKNQKISETRANNIRALFERLGLERNRIFPFGMGENDSLIYPHRRVEIRSCAIQ